MKKTVALIQARMSSSRLPGKVLMDIGGEPMIIRVVKRSQKAKTLGDMVVITSDHQDDDALEKICLDHGVSCFRGNLHDVLDRYYQAAKRFQAEIIVRITGDCPLLDPAIVDQVVRTFHKGSYDYVSNILECTFPDGLDTEVFRMETLERAWLEARLKSEREHVTAFIYNHPELFRCGCVKHTKDLSSLRWTVDTSEDLAFVRAVYTHFATSDFGMLEILELLKRDPALGRVNAHLQRNEGYLKSLRGDKLVQE